MRETVVIPCPSCNAVSKHTLPYQGLYHEQIEEIVSGEGEATIELTQEQMRINGLTSKDVNFCEEERRNWVNIFIEDVYCAECGRSG